jgi:hypothetical protein
MEYTDNGVTKYLDAFVVVHPIDTLKTLNIMSHNNKMQPGALSHGVIIAARYLPKTLL